MISVFTIAILLIMTQNSGHIMAHADFIVPHYGNQNEYVIFMVMHADVFK